MSKKFKDVIEIYDEGDKERLIKLEVTKKELIRSSKNPKWESRTSLKSIESYSYEMGKFRKPDSVIVSLRSKQIEWKLKKGKKLIDAIEDVW